MKSSHEKANVLAIMQPYFLPYIGYFQLIAAADLFVVYDNVQYTKKGWINRNRMLRNGKDVTFSIPLTKASDYLDVRERELASDFNRGKLLNQIKGAYLRAPFFAQAFPLIESIVNCEESNLFRYLFYSIEKACDYLGITTEIGVSSGIDIDHGLKGQDRVIALCNAVAAKTYVNPIGGKALYSREAFRAQGIELKFIESKPIEYSQFGKTFVPALSILDVMMFNPRDTIQEWVATGYEFV